jgi:cytochrome d ubiquinol oxidase subunit II
MPLVGIFFLAGVLLVLYGVAHSLLSKTFTKGIWWAGAGTVITVTCLLLLVGWNNTVYYPSNFGDLQSGLTIANSSSSQKTLTIMTYVSFLVPFVLAYIFYAWRSLEKKKFDAVDLKEDGHVY